MRKRKLTAAEWTKVLALRCRGKQGLPLEPADRTLVDAAFNENPERYASLEVDVFNATIPFGSTARRRKE